MKRREAPRPPAAPLSFFEPMLSLCRFCVLLVLAARPAGPAARDVRLIWWVMLGFATIVLIGVTVVWLYAFKPRNVERTPAQERRIARRWIIGGGLVLPITSVTALLMFGVPAGQRMLPL